MLKMSQQSGSLQYDPANLTIVLVALVVIGLAIYVYFEFNKIKARLLELLMNFGIDFIFPNSFQLFKKS